MPNFSNAKFAINRKSQADKDTIKVDDLVRFPFKYGNNSGFTVVPDADTYDDIVDPQFESSKVQILGALTAGAVTVPADADFIALMLASILGTINTTNPTAGVYSHAITPSSVATPNFHTVLYSDGTCDSRLVGAVPGSLEFGADFQNKRMEAAVSFTGIRMDDNDGANTKTVTVANATEIWTATAHGFVDGEAVRLSNSGGVLPSGANNTTVYYVEVLSANTFYLHTLWNGAIGKLTSTRLNVTTDGTGTQTATKYLVSYPTQAAINPFHFTNTGALLTINKNGAGAVDYTSKWAGFGYSLQDGVSAEQRAGSNTIRVIERQDRAQQLSLILDYDDATFKDIVRDYQKNTSPDKFEIVMTLQGKLIGATTYYYSISATFYNCNLIGHDYTKVPEIGKQSLTFRPIYDSVASKSVQWTVQNDTVSYLT